MGRDPAHDQPWTEERRLMEYRTQGTYEHAPPGTVTAVEAM